MIVREFKEEFFDKYYSVRCESFNIIASGYTTPPEYNLLKSFFISRMNNPNRTDYLFFTESEDLLGYGFFDSRSGDIDVGCAVSIRFHQKGYGMRIAKFIIREAKKKYPNKKIISTAAQKNTITIKMLNELGFINTHTIVENSQFNIREDYGEVELYELRG